MNKIQRIVVSFEDFMEGDYESNQNIRSLLCKKILYQQKRLQERTHNAWPQEKDIKKECLKNHSSSFMFCLKNAK